MGNLIFRRITSEGADTGRSMVWFWCPGCEDAHAFEVPRWHFNGDVERPSFTPSLLMNGREGLRNPAVPRCHLFLVDGELQFLPDCSHRLAGQTVPLPSPPEWLV